MARRPFSSQSLVLIVIAIAINMIGGQLISMLKLPIFLDSIGTLISAVLLGPFIGMLTGLLTNLLWGLLTDPIAAAFAPVAMVIGLVAGWLARAGWFRTLPKVIVTDGDHRLGAAASATVTYDTAFSCDVSRTLNASVYLVNLMGAGGLHHAATPCADRAPGL